MFFKKLRTRRKKAASVVSTALAHSAHDALLAQPIAPINDVVLARPAARDKVGHLGMQGAPPIVGVSKNRKRCEGCKELVKPGVRHICIHNAHHHLDTLTPEERSALIEQLKSLGVKPS